MPLSDEENVVRAICTEKYDSVTGRISPSLFKGPYTSVSRLSIFSIDEQWRILVATVQKQSGRLIERLGEINVGTLSSLGRNYVANGKAMPVSLSVVEDPTPANKAHAVIPENITAGLGKKIVDNLILHKRAGELISNDSENASQQSEKS